MPNLSQKINPVSTTKTRKNYNNISKWYDMVSGTREKQIFDQGVQIFSTIKGGKILEIGCGTGYGLSSLNKYLDQTNRIFGLDLSEGMLRKTRKRIKFQGLNKIHLQQADARFLPFDHSSFSGIILGFTIELFPVEEIPMVLSECERVLKPEGKIVIVCMADAISIPVKIYNYFHNLFPKFIDCKPIEINAFVKNLNFDSISISTKSLWGLPVDIATISYHQGDKVLP
jgi:ubiquinone/menaquinone biosynthesis C-methylase UbiE